MAWERGCKLQGNLVCSHLVCIYLPLALVSFSAINYITYYIISLITDKVFKNNAFRKPRGKCKNEVRLLDHLKLKFGHRWQSKLITIKHHILQYILIFAPMFLLNITSISLHALQKQTIFRLVPPNSRNFTDGVHIAIYKTCLTLGYFNAGYIYVYMEYILPCIICYTLTFLCYFVYNRDIYGNLNPSLEKYKIK